MNIVEKRIYADGEPYYFNTETTEKYGEIVGGFAWPGTKDGFLVIAAVDLFGNTDFEARHIRILAEASESDLDNLLKHALKLQKHFSPFMETIRFYGDTTNLAMIELLGQFNRNRRSRGLDTFYLTEAIQLKHPEKLDFYASIIRKYTQPGREVMHFCDTALPGYLVGLSPDEISKSVLEDPPLAALGYALAVLSTWKPRKGAKGPEKRETEVLTKYERVPNGKLVEEMT